MTAERVICPYCGTSPKKNVHTHRVVCACSRLHEYQDFNNKKYNVLYKKDGTKEIYSWKD